VTRLERHLRKSPGEKSLGPTIGGAPRNMNPFTARDADMDMLVLEDIEAVNFGRGVPDPTPGGAAETPSAPRLRSPFYATNEDFAVAAMSGPNRRPSASEAKDPGDMRNPDGHFPRESGPMWRQTSFTALNLAPRERRNTSPASVNTYLHAEWTEPYWDAVRDDTGIWNSPPPPEMEVERAIYDAMKRETIEVGGYNVPFPQHPKESDYDQYTDSTGATVRHLNATRSFPFRDRENSRWTDGHPLYHATPTGSLPKILAEGLVANAERQLWFGASPTVWNEQFPHNAPLRLKSPIKGMSFLRISPTQTMNERLSRLAKVSDVDRATVPGSLAIDSDGNLIGPRDSRAQVAVGLLSDALWFNDIEIPTENIEVLSQTGEWIPLYRTDLSDVVADPTSGPEAGMTNEKNRGIRKILSSITNGKHGDDEGADEQKPASKPPAEVPVVAQIPNPEPRIKYSDSYGGDDLIKNEQRIVRIDHEGLVAAGRWEDIHGDHYDWWAYPIDRGSGQYGEAFNVAGEPLRRLREDPEFLASLAREIEIQALALGWSLYDKDWVEKLDWENGQDWRRAYPTRLWKATRSAQIFGLQREFESMLALHDSLAAGGVRFNHEDYWESPGTVDDVPSLGKSWKERQEEWRQRYPASDATSWTSPHRPMPQGPKRGSDDSQMTLLEEDRAWDAYDSFTTPIFPVVSDAEELADILSEPDEMIEFGYPYERIDKETRQLIADDIFFAVSLLMDGEFPDEEFTDRLESAEQMRRYANEQEGLYPDDGDILYALADALENPVSLYEDAVYESTDSPDGEAGMARKLRTTAEMDELMNEAARLYNEGKPRMDIAREMNLPRDTISNLLQRANARKLLRNYNPRGSGKFGNTVTTPENIAAAADKYREGKTFAQIAEELAVPGSSVIRLVAEARRLGLDTGPRRNRTSSEVEELMLEVAIKYEEGKSFREIAQEMGVNINTVQNMANRAVKLGLIRRDRIERASDAADELTKEIMTKLGQGKSQRQIARELNVPYLRVTNLIKRARRILAPDRRKARLMNSSESPGDSGAPDGEAGMGRRFRGMDEEPDYSDMSLSDTEIQNFIESEADKVTDDLIFGREVSRAFTQGEDEPVPPSVMPVRQISIPTLEEIPEDLKQSYIKLWAGGGSFVAINRQLGISNLDGAAIQTALLRSGEILPRTKRTSGDSLRLTPEDERVFVEWSNEGADMGLLASVFGLTAGQTAEIAKDLRSRGLIRRRFQKNFFTDSERDAFATIVKEERAKGRGVWPRSVLRAQRELGWSKQRAQAMLLWYRMQVKFGHMPGIKTQLSDSDMMRFAARWNDGVPEEQIAREFNVAEGSVKWLASKVRKRGIRLKRRNSTDLSATDGLRRSPRLSREWLEGVENGTTSGGYQEFMEGMQKRAVALYRDGRTYDQIAKELGITGADAKYLVDRAVTSGEKSPRRRGPRSKVAAALGITVDELVERMAARYNEGKTGAEMATEFGTTIGNLNYFLRVAGKRGLLKLRTKRKKHPVKRNVTGASSRKTRPTDGSDGEAGMSGPDSADLPDGIDGELEDYVYEDPVFGLSIQHPLFLWFARITPEVVDLINASFAKKRASADEALRQKNWGRYIYLHERPYRIDAFEDIMDELTDQEYWSRLSDIWVDSENIGQQPDRWRNLLLSERGSRESFMTEDERAEFAALQPQFTVYRGYSENDQEEFGMSWSTDAGVAEWFARRFAREDDKIFMEEMEVSKDDVFAYLTRRGEEEIILDMRTATGGTAIRRQLKKYPNTTSGPYAAKLRKLGVRADGEAGMSSRKIPKFNGGHSSKGRGTPSGDGKDLAMRDVADSAIVELANDERSSSRTTLETLGSYRAGSMVVMLARNGELRGIPLRDETIQAITKAHDDGATFVVGDMPGVDSQFVEFLDKIGADYTIYHAGSSPRFRPQPPDARGDAPSELLARVTDEDAQLSLLYSVPGVAASVRMRSTDGAPVAPGKNAIMKPYLLAPHIDVNGLDASDPAIQSLSPALKAAGLGTYKVTGHSTPKVQGPVVKEFADRLIGPSAVADAVLGTFPTADELLTIYAVNALIRARAEYLSDSVLNADQVNEAILFGNVMLVGPKLPQDLWDIPQVGTSLYLDPFSYFGNDSNFLKAVIDALPERVRSGLAFSPAAERTPGVTYQDRSWGDTSLFEGIIIREDDDISRRFAPMIRKQAGIVLDHARRHGELARKWAQTAYDLMREAGLTDAEVAFVVNEHWRKASAFKLATVQPGNVLGHAARLGVKAFSSRYSPISQAITGEGPREEEDFGLHEFFHHFLGQGFTRHGEYVAFRGPVDLIDSYHGHMQWAWNDTRQLGMFVSRIMTQEFGRGKTDQLDLGYSRTFHDTIGRAIYDRLKEMLSSAEDRREIMDQVFPEFHGSPSEDEAKIKALIRRQFAGRDLERVRQFADLMPVLRLLTVQDLLVPKMYYPYGGTSKIIGGSN